MLNIVTLSSLYPSSVAPRHGIFVEERLRHLLATGRVAAEVIAPVPWFPFKSGIFGRFGVYGRISHHEIRMGLTVSYPRFLSVPAVNLSLSPFMMAMAVAGRITRLKQRTQARLIVDAHYLYPDGVAAALISRHLRVPCILTARGQDVTLFPRYRIPKALLVWAMRQACKVITVSNALRREVMALGIEPEHVVTLRNGVDLQKFPLLDKNGSRARAGFAKPTILSVGHLIERKGHELTIKALAHLPGVELRLVGEGPLKGSLIKLARERGVSDRVSITATMSQDDLTTLYNAADIFVLASRHEGMANVLLESLACGTPVVTTAVEGTEEIVTRPEAGLIVHDREPGSVARAVRAVLELNADRSRVRAHAAQLGWAPTIAGLLDILEEAARSGSHPGGAELSPRQGPNGFRA